MFAKHYGRALIGSFTSWLSATVVFAGNISRSGVDYGDGWFTALLGVGLVGVAVWWYSTRERASGGTGAVVSAILLAIWAYDYRQVSDKVDQANAKIGKYGTVSVGTGIWLILVGGVLALGGSVWAYRRSSRTASHAVPTSTAVPPA